MAIQDNDVRIGDFSQPLRPPAPGTSTAPVATIKDGLDGVAQQLAAGMQQDEQALQPLVAYENRLRAANVTVTQAHEIIDAVLLQGFYSEDVTLTPTIHARFRTRSARDTKRAQEMLETQRLTYDIHYAEIMARYLLAASLESLGTTRLPHSARTAKAEEVEQAYQTRLKFVEELADPALRLLLQKLSKFDQRVNTVLEEGAIENF